MADAAQIDAPRTDAPSAAVTQASSAVPDKKPDAAAEALEADLNRAREAASKKRFNEAVGICQDILSRKPDSARAMAIIGTVHAQRGEVEQAIHWTEQSLKTVPDVPAWQANLCALYRLLNRCEDSVRMGQAAVKAQPNNPQFLLNLALALVDVGERTQATNCILRALGHNHEEPSCHLALAQLLLTEGEMDPGWIEYEWRNKTEAAKGTLPRILSAPWTGAKVKGRLLLVGDQGYGDTIQFARYIPLAVERCDELIVGCSPDILPMLRDIPGITSIHSRWDEIPSHVAHARLSSLALFFQTRLDSIPSPQPYMRPQPERVAHWAKRLDEKLGTRARRIGIAWTGRPTHPNDRRRSMRLATMVPLAELDPDIRFVCLQRPVPAIDKPAFARFNGLEDLSESLTDFGETAAVIANLDLVITIDTAVGHLSGAIGAPVWILLAQPNDWRWMLDRSDSVWYESVKLIRQPAPGHWNEVIASAADGVRQWLASAPSRS